MKLKIIKGINEIGRELLEIQTNEARVVIGFGEEKATGYIYEKYNPMIEGLTTGTPKYDGIFILRNLENCNLINYSLKEIPIFVGKKLKNNYDTYMDFFQIPKKDNIQSIIEFNSIKIKDIEVTLFIVDPSNFNTYILRIRDANGKSVVVCGDFRNYDGEYNKNKLKEIISIILKTDIVVVEGKYLGKSGIEYSSGKDILDKIKNIMKVYKQIFVIQSETDLIMTANLYKAAQKAKRIFIENTLLCNLVTLSNGSLPNPFNAKKVYSYTPLVYENRDFDFKKKYIAPFYMNSAINKLKKEKYVMNITKDMIQDFQIFEKEDSFYDACLIFAEWKGFIKQDGELEEFINILKNYNIDYYDLYTHGQVNMVILKEIEEKLMPKYIIPLDFSNEEIVYNELERIKTLEKDNELEI